MAVLFGGAGSRTILRTPGTSVWVRAPIYAVSNVTMLWGGNIVRPPWQWIPWLEPQTLRDTTFPHVAEATFRYRYGKQIRQGLAAWRYFPPLNIEGYEIVVIMHNEFGDWPVWRGLVENCGLDAEGTPYYAQGWQTITAYGIEHVFDRIHIRGAMTDAGRIDRYVRHNERRAHGMAWVGNMSTGHYAGDVHCFSEDGEVWNNLEILRYLLAVYSPVTVSLVGYYSLLESISQVHDFEGMTLLDAINRLIPRDRGLGANLFYGSGTWAYSGGVPVFDDTVYLAIHSMLPNAISYYDETLPANQFQDLVTFEDDPRIEVRINYDNLSKYDRVRVEGARVGVCFSLSYADATLTERWETQAETDYQAGSGAVGAAPSDHDAERATDKFRDVYVAHSVPVSWNFRAGDGEGGTLNNVVPTMLSDGTPDFTTAGTAWLGQAEFERELPLFIEASPGEGEPRKTFAVVADAEGAFFYVDRLSSIGNNGADVNVEDGTLVVLIRPVPAQHLFALNHWGVGAALTLKTPTWDYEDLIATVFLRTDVRLAVSAVLPAGWGYQASELLVRDDNADYIKILPGTITDVTDGALVKSAGVVVRDDSALLRKRACFAIAYWGVPRGTIRLDIGCMTLAHAPGHMILGCVKNPAPNSAARWTSGGFAAPYFLPVGTVVTQRTWTFDQDGIRTEITTGFEEISLR